MKERFLVPHLKRYGFRLGLFKRPTRLRYNGTDLSPSGINAWS